VVTPVLLRYDLTATTFVESGFANQGTRQVASSTCRLVAEFRRQPVLNFGSVVGSLTITHRRFVVGNIYVKLTDQFFGLSHKTSHFLGSYCTDY